MKRFFGYFFAVAGIIVMAGLFAAVSAGSSPAYGAVPSVTPSASSVNEAPDYACENWSDPWDYSNAEDLSLTPNVQSGGITNATMTGGNLAFDTTGPGNFIEPAWGSGALPHGRDTDIHPIDAGKYTRLSFRMYASADDNGGQISWFSCDGATPDCWGAMPMPVKQGWHTYDVQLAPGYGPGAAAQPWAGQIRVLRFSPAGGAIHVEFDWMRLYQPGPSVTLTVQGGSASQVWFDTDSDPSNNDPTQVSGKSAGQLAGYVPNGGTVSFPAAAYPPGTYRFYTVSGGQVSAYSNPLTINPEPEPVVTAPSITGGDDYASVVRHDAWDFSQPSDITGIYNSTAQFVNGVLAGGYAGPNPWDPQVYLSSPGLINASLYHHLTFRVWYDGPFGLQDAPGGGMVARFIWKINNVWHNSQDMIIFPGWNTVSIDLKTNPPSLVDDETDPNPIGWGAPASQWVQEVRFDPHEDPGGRTWWLDDIRLTTNNYGNPNYNIQFQDNTWTQGTTADIYADTGPGGYGGYRIASGVSVAQGTNTYNWNGNAIPSSGSWWVYVVLHHPDGSTGRAYSTGPVEMTPQPDSTPPVVTYAGPSGTVNQGNPAVTASVSDPSSPTPSSGINVDSARMTLNGGLAVPCSVAGGNISCPTSGLDNGSYTAQISVKDNAGNQGTATGTFNVSGQSYTVYNNYFTWYDNVAGSDWVLMANPSAAAGGDLTFSLNVGGAAQMINPLPFLAIGQAPAGKSVNAFVPGLQNGPVDVGVKAAAGSGARGISSQRILWPRGGSSLEEVPGVDATRLSSDYWWTWYDQQTAGMSNWIMVANPSAASVYYQIRIAGNPQPVSAANPGVVPAGGKVMPTFPGIMGGPVELKACASAFDQSGNCPAPANVIASQRVLSGGGAAFNEVPGTPAAELDSDYLWTWYDQQSPGALDWVMVANPSNTSTAYYQVGVAGGCGGGNAGACQYGSLGPGQHKELSFPGTIGGPVEAKGCAQPFARDGSCATAPQSLVASQRSIWGPSFEEVPGYPASRLSSSYNWTWYDQNSGGSLNWVMITNPSAANSVYYQVKIAGQVQPQSQTNPGVIPPGGRVMPSFPGVIGGPVEVSAWSGDPDPAKGVPASVMASQRVLWNGQFNEVLGTVLN